MVIPDEVGEALVALPNTHASYRSRSPQSLPRLQATGLAIPQDVSVVGFDNTYLCEFLHPPLTTVATPRIALADNVLDMLFSHIDGEHFSREAILPVSIIIRQSTSHLR